MKAFAMIFAIALFAAGCATVTADTPADTPKAIATKAPDKEVNSESAPVSVTGVWKADLKYHDHISKLTMRLKQAGNTVEGTIDVSTGHSVNYNNVAVNGKLEGNKLSLKIPSFSYGSITATFVGDRLEDGYYRGQTNYGARFSAERVKK